MYSSIIQVSIPSQDWEKHFVSRRISRTFSCFRSTVLLLVHHIFSLACSSSGCHAHVFPFHVNIMMFMFTFMFIFIFTFIFTFILSSTASRREEFGKQVYCKECFSGYLLYLSKNATFLLYYIGFTKLTR